MKDNSATATLRKMKPKADKVKDAEVKKGAANAAARKQLRVDEEDGTFSVIPNSRIPAPPCTSGRK